MENYRTKPPVTNYPQRAMRKRAKQRAYIGNGIMKIARPPVSTLATLVLIAVIAATWKVSVAFAAPLNITPALVPAVIYILRISFLLVASLLFVGFLYLLGKPHRAQEIERDLAAAFGIAKSSPLFYRCPFLCPANLSRGLQQGNMYSGLGGLTLKNGIDPIHEKQFCGHSMLTVPRILRLGNINTQSQFLWLPV